jgi:predicted O-methyltransferase YrrM
VLVKMHVESFLRQEELGSRIPAYRPSFDFLGVYIDAVHQSLAEVPLKHGSLIQIKNRRWFGRAIAGWLRREDALKLYELAYFAPGDILELGAYHGLSTSILARAARNCPQAKHVYSVELSSSCVKATLRNLRWMGLQGDVTILCVDAVAAVKGFAGTRQRFGCVFVDHSHAYAPVFEVCRELGNVTAAGGYCLFHDFNDRRNSNPDYPGYGVYQAVLDGLDHTRFEFCGIYGCTGLYRVK